MESVNTKDQEMKIHQKVCKGQVLLKEEPFVFVLGSKQLSEYCDHCFNKGELLRCSNCQYVHYCGKDCQREAWSVHKLECKNLKRVAPRIVPNAARLLARLVLKLNTDGNQIRSYINQLQFRMFKDLMSHYSDLKQDSKRLEHFTSLYGVLKEFIGHNNLPNAAELLGIYGRMCINSFTICDAEMLSVGAGIYLGASIIDHSCRPNAVAVFEGTTLYIRATEDLPYLDWSQIKISYIELLNTIKQRQSELLETYYFLCQCPRCLEEPQLGFINAAACPNKLCNSFVNIDQDYTLDRSCSKCGTLISDQFLMKFKDIVDFTEMHLKNMQSMTYLDVCKFCLEKQQDVFYKYNILRVKTLDLAFNSSIDFLQWKDAEIFGKELIDCYKTYYGPIHPLFGLLCLKLGKILVYEEKNEEARKYLKMAHDVLKITHGATSKLFRFELMPLLQETHPIH